MKNFIVQADRILLKSLTIEDAESLYQYRNIPVVSIFQGWTPSSPQEVADLAKEMGDKQIFSVGNWYQIIIQRKTDKQVLGDIGVCIDPETNQQA